LVRYSSPDCRANVRMSFGYLTKTPLLLIWTDTNKQRTQSLPFYLVIFPIHWAIFALAQPKVTMAQRQLRICWRSPISRQVHGQKCAIRYPVDSAELRMASM